MKLRTTMLTAATFAVTAASALTITGTAAATTDPAGWDHVWTSHDGGATVYVNRYKDNISLCDVKKDGRAARVEVYVGNATKPVYTMSTTGCATHWEPDGGKYNLPEGKEIHLYFGTREGRDNLTHQKFLNNR
ncbi:hypothetical protein [Amycolatopsis granulosa]|uniref:hypothetical protein n=1 Tax=Amycolatopsis granulosa TaxID=185684 RepID=UPI0014223D0C|nr:hypothetical protein [Amycolatopsis granulosa]NIH87187.1 hypothetical protein [Amycolatopsis granulosa]